MEKKSRIDKTFFLNSETNFAPFWPPEIGCKNRVHHFELETISSSKNVSLECLMKSFEFAVVEKFELKTWMLTKTISFKTLGCKKGK